jgi:thiamine pyrophosphokinase
LFLRAVIFANGIIEESHGALADKRHDDLVIAADGGAHNSLQMGLNPNVVIGDLDSISEPVRETLRNNGATFIAFSRDKDQTDLELALEYARRTGAREILLLGLLGGRLDQTLANLLLLSRDEFSSLALTVVNGPDTAYLLSQGNTRRIQGEPGDIVSLIPLSQQVAGVTTGGLRWPLRAARLEFGSTLSVSNELTGTEATVQIEQGKLLLVHRKAEVPG